MVREYRMMLDDGLMPYLNEIKKYDENHGFESDDYFEMVYQMELMTGVNNCAEEFFYVISFGDIKDDIKFMQCAHGSHQSVEVILRPLCTFLLLVNCRECVVLHNHPNNVVEPSDADVSFTKHLQESLELLDIKLNEHLILGKDGFYQMYNELFVPRKFYDYGDPEYPGLSEAD